ncbi:MAG: transglycosylase SLT domain-containing protein [Candidatus Dormibacteraceae bacterium]
MIRGRNAIRVIVLAALVIAVAFSSTVASRFAGGTITLTRAQTRAQATHQERQDLAWQAQLANEQGQLKQAQQQQAAAATAAANNAKSTLTPLPTPTPAPSTSSSGSGSGPAPSEPAGSIQAIIVAAFQSQGSGAVNWGLCIAEHESGDDPNAQNPSGASGLFQFMPSTFAATPQGQAGESIWDPTANAEAAAWKYSQGGQSAWSTNGMC